MNHKRICIISLAVAVSIALVSTFSYAKKHVSAIPKQYRVILDKKWVFTQCLYNGKDETENYKKNELKGIDEYYIFRKNGSAETNSPDVLSATWKYENNMFVIYQKFSGESGSGESSVKYTIGKATAEILQLDLKPMKMSLIYAVKKK